MDGALVTGADRGGSMPVPVPEGYDLTDPDIYAKDVKSLPNKFRVTADSPTLINFLSLVKWVDADAEKKLAADIGMHAPT